MKLIVGLGNPGKEYEGTRHNIGRDVVRALTENLGLNWKLEKKLHAELAILPPRQNPLPGKHAIARISGTKGKTIFALPTTYMNESGKAVQQLLTTYNLQLTTLLVVHDDLDLPLRTLRFSKGSGAAGQKGVQSIIDSLGTKEFVRLRIGVAGAHRATTDATEYVLKRFSHDEQQIVKKIKERAMQTLKDFINEPLAKVMNRYNAHEISASRSD